MRSGNQSLQEVAVPAFGRTTPFALVGALALLAGCSGLPEPNAEVEQQWGLTMRRLSMFGLYPLREDVQVGDMLFYAPPGCSTRRPARMAAMSAATAWCPWATPWRWPPTG
jgi:hypothetical protein